jgi:endonuclease-3
MTPQQRNSLFQRLQALNPQPETELVYASAFELMIAVMLSAQSTDKRVNEVTRVLFASAKTPQAMIQLGEEKLREIIRSVNYYLTKAKHIIKTCQILVEQFHGEVPNDRKALESLPGIGRKTANVILNVAFGHPTIAVDTHIFRVANRTGLAHGKTPFEVEQTLEKTIDPMYLSQAHHWLVLHGRYICTARAPHCPICPIRDLCEFKNKTN